MKPIILGASLGLLAFFLVPSAYAQPGEGGTAFAEIKAGIDYWALNDDYDGDAKDSSRSAQIGYRWGMGDNSGFGIEGGYIDFGHIHKTNGSVEYTAKGRAVTVGIDYEYASGGMSNGFLINVRGGVLRWQGNATGSVDVNYLGQLDLIGMDTGTGTYAGLGLGYYFSSRLALTVNYDYYQADIFSGTAKFTVYSIGAEFRF
ncbi:MAG TPA: outer membrane beta-barrel protein [Gammaproteobacteria bacterium]|nr:outer membrane beta-barrel protein [Gammaproteobacteria bacterium]